MSSTTTETAKMDPLQQDILQTTFGGAKDIMETPFEAYTGEMVAGPTALTTSALEGYGELGMGREEYDQALKTMYGISSITPEQRRDTISGYAQDYTDAILDPTLNALRRERAQQRVAEAGGITKSGAFGNIRRGVFEGEREGEFEARMGQTEANIRSQAMRDAEARYAREVGMDLGTAQALAGAGTAKMQSELAGLGAQMTAGEAERAIQQAGLSAEMQEFMRQQQYPLQQFQSLIQVLGGTPTGYGTTTTTDPYGGLKAIGSAMEGAGSLASGGKAAGIF